MWFHVHVVGGGASSGKLVRMISLLICASNWVHATEVGGGAAPTKNIFIPPNAPNGTRGSTPATAPIPRTSGKTPVKVVPVVVPRKPPVKAPPPRAPVRPAAPTSAATRKAQVTAYINEITLSGRKITVPPSNQTDPLVFLPAEDLALRWLINDDPLKLTPTSNAAKFRLRQRYALTSMWFQPRSEGPGWYDPRGWLTNTSECTWKGITCITRNVGGTAGFQSVVTKLDLNSYLLQGAITPELGLLSSSLTFAKQCHFQYTSRVIGTLNTIGVL